MNTAQTILLGRNDRIRASATNGISTPSNLYFSRILIAWMIWWDFVKPITARGLRLKTSKNRCLTFLGMDE
jgi:hypothetical protein